MKKTRIISVSLPTELAVRLRAVSRYRQDEGMENATISAVLREAIEFYLEKGREDERG
jgi:predicted DNA-binding protein